MKQSEQCSQSARDAREEGQRNKFLPMIVLIMMFLVGCSKGMNETEASEDFALRHNDTTIHTSAVADQLTEMGLGSWAVLVSSLQTRQGPVKILEPVLMETTGELADSVVVTALGRATSDLNDNPRRWLTRNLTTTTLPFLTLSTGGVNVAFGIAFAEPPPDGSFSLDSDITVSRPHRYPGGRSRTLGPRSVADADTDTMRHWNLARRKGYAPNVSGDLCATS